MATKVFFDVSILASPEFLRVEKKIGAVAASMMFKLDLWLWSCKAHAFEMSDLDILAESLKFDLEEFRDFIEASIEFGLFTQIRFFTGGAEIRSPRVDDQIDGLRRRTKGLKKGVESPLLPRDGPVTESVTESVTAPSQDKIGLDKTGSDQILEGGAGETLLISFPEFDTPSVHATIAAWKVYLEKRHRRHFDQLQLDPLLQLYKSRGPEALIAALRHSQSNGWKSPIDPPERNGRTTDPPKSFQTQMLDRSLEALKEKEAKGLL